MADEVLVEFRAEFDKLKKDYAEIAAKLSDIGTQSKKAGDEVSANVKKVSGDLESFKGGLKEVANLAGIVFGGHAIIEFGKESVHAFQEAEEAAHELKFAITEIGEEGEKSFQKLLKQSKELQKNSIFSDDEIQKTQRMLAVLGLTADQIEKTVPKIINMASATDKNLGAATERVIQGINGQVRGLKQVGIAYEDTGSKTKNLGILLDKLNKFQGAAAEAAETSAGKIAKLKNAYNDLQELIGEAITKTTEFSAVSNLLELATGNITLEQLKERDVMEKLRSVTNVYFEEFLKGSHAQKAAILENTIERSKQLRLELTSSDPTKVAAANAALKANTELLNKLTEESRKEGEERLKINDDLTLKGIQNAKQGADKIKEIRDKQRKDEIEAEKKSIEEAEKLAAEWLNNEFELLQATNKRKISETQENTQERLDAQIEAITSEAEFRIRTEELTQTEIQTIQEEGLAKINELQAAQQEKDNQFAEERFNEIVAQGERQKEYRKQLAEAELDVERAKFDALIGLTDAFAGLVKNDAALSQSLLIFQRGLAIADVLFKLQQEKAGWYATAAEQSVLDPAGAAIHQAVALARAQAANVRAGVAAATILAQTIPQLKFAEGTEYLKRGKYKKGVDTIPILANEGERIIPTNDNLQNWDIYEALRLGKFEKYVSLNYVAPAMEMAQEVHAKQADKAFANNIYNSMMYNYGSDKGIEKLLKKGLFIRNMPDDKDKISLMELKLLERRLYARS